MSSQDSFFPDPLDEYNPKPKFPFDDRPIADYDEEGDECPVCTILLSEHSLKEVRTKS